MKYILIVAGYANGWRSFHHPKTGNEFRIGGPCYENGYGYKTYNSDENRFSINKLNLK